MNDLRKAAEPVAYTGNGTAGREADVQPTGFLFQMPKPVGEVYGWHGTGKGQPMCRFDTTEAEMPVGTKLFTAPPKREWVGLTDDEILSEAKRFALGLSFPFNGITTPEMFARSIEAKLKEKNA